MVQIMENHHVGGGTLCKKGGKGGSYRMLTKGGEHNMRITISGEDFKERVRVEFQYWKKVQNYLLKDLTLILWKA